MAIRMVFLDLNGTLIDDWPSHEAGIQAVFRTNGLPEPALAEFLRFVSQTGDYLSFYHKHGLAHLDKDTIYDVYHASYQEHQEMVRLVPGALQTLRELRRAKKGSAHRDDGAQGYG